MWFRKRNRRQATQASARGAQAGWLTLEKCKRMAQASGYALLAAAIIWSALALIDRPVRRVEVTGHFLRVSPLEIEQAVMAFTKHEVNTDRGFVSLDLDALKAVLEEIAWVDHARLERRWPDVLRVAISEQIPGARWGERGLLNSRGELFVKEARYLPPELPQLNGPEGTEAQVARLYLDTYPRLAGVGLRLARVTLDARGAWELTVARAQSGSNGGIVVRLGRRDVQERLDRFISAASPLIAARADEVRYVDMRYSNGFAVGWLDPTVGLANRTFTKGPRSDG